MIEDLVVNLIGNAPSDYEYIQYSFEGFVMLIVILGVVLGVVVFFCSFSKLFK